jgi:hypothetical protein
VEYRFLKLFWTGFGNYNFVLPIIGIENLCYNGAAERPMGTVIDPLIEHEVQLISCSSFRSMAVIRASDIGNFLFCRRAWWYRMQGVEPDNQAELAAGSEAHRLHGQAVFTANLYRTAGYVLLLIALVFLIYSAVSTFLE